MRVETVFVNEMRDPLGRNIAALRKFACTKCPSAFQSRQSLLRHTKQECGQEPKYKCPYCDRLVKKSSNAYTHVRRQHPNLEVYIIDLRSGEEAKVRVPKLTSK